MAPRSLNALVPNGAVVLAAALGAALLFVCSPAHAHFQLEAPASWMTQDGEGAPEKYGPCGNEGGGTPTNTITAFKEGQQITVTVNELIFHPGHYRIALSMNGPKDDDSFLSDFPADPTVTAGPANSGTVACTQFGKGTNVCGSVPIENPPVFPVLADDVFEHCEAFTKPQSVTVTLPAGVTCDECTLQVLEFMSDHGSNLSDGGPDGCFYHHCANISIAGQSVTVDSGAPIADASEPPTADGASDLGESGASSGESAGEASGSSSGGAGGSGTVTGSTGSSGSSGGRQEGSGAASSGAAGSGGGSVSTGPESTPPSGGCSTIGGGLDGMGAGVLLFALTFVRWRRRH